MYAVVLSDDMPARTTVRERLAERGIETRSFFHPLHKQPVFLDNGMAAESDTLPISERLGRRGLYLPSSPSLSEQDVEGVCGAVRAALEGSAR